MKYFLSILLITILLTIMSNMHGTKYMLKTDSCSITFEYSPTVNIDGSWEVKIVNIKSFTGHDKNVEKTNMDYYGDSYYTIPSYYELIELN